MTNHRRAALLLIFLTLFGTSALFAGGRQEEDPILVATELIEQKKFNEAVAVLTQAAKEDPDRFDDIQRQLNIIREAREAINTKYEELLETFETDLQQAYVLIKELEEMDPYPNERSRESIVRARETAGFVYNRNRWEEIMDAALAQIQQGQYWEAVQTYRGGFDLSRDIFYDAGYGQIVVERVDTRTSELTAYTEDFVAAQEPLSTHRTAERAMAEASVSYTEYLDSFEPLLADLNQLGALMISLQEMAQFYLDYEETIRLSRGDGKEVHHLIYLALLISGRPDNQGKEGIKGAVELAWEETLKELNRHTEALLSASFQAGLDGFNAGEDETIRPVLSETVNLAGLHLRSLQGWAGKFPLDDQGNLPESGSQFLESYRPERTLAAVKGDASAAYLNLLDRRRRFAELVTARQIVAGYDEGSRVRTDLLAERELLEEQRASWSDRIDEIQALASSDPSFAEALSLGQGVRSVIDGYLSDSQEEEVVLVTFIEDLSRAPLREQWGTLESRYSRAVELLDGVPLTLADAEEPILVPYPDQALEILSALPADVAALNSAFTIVHNRLTAETVRGAQPIEALVAEGEDYLNRLSGLSADIAAAAGRAEEEIFLANRFRQEGDRRLLEARRLTDQGQFAGAKERLTAASSRYDESLIHQEDPALRNIRDIEIPALYEEIRRAENRLVIQQVRQYLTQGQSLYSQNEFAAANNLFLRAENRWADTNADPNPEVEYWLELTRTALSVTTGREIAPTDPLYGEMFQYLNQATEDYNRGRSLLTAGDAAEADVAFDNAESNLLLVQQFFPFNKEARVLTIKIAQQRDPAGFRELFSRDFQTAREKIGESPQEAYVELKDLEALEPGYPGLQAAIEEAEYATGIKVRPPDLTKVNRSNELLAQAQAIVNRNVRTDFPVALAYLDEALSLNPNNTAAIRLKDTVAIAVGGNTTTVLSSADQQKYNEAVAEFNAGNYLRAQIIVEILLENPDNRNNTRLLELKERIQSAQ